MEESHRMCKLTIGGETGLKRELSDSAMEKSEASKEKSKRSSGSSSERRKVTHDEGVQTENPTKGSK